MTHTPATETARKHPYDYYWRPGAQLRPAPPRVRFEDIWTHTRREVPAPTERTKLFMDHEWQGDEIMDALVARFREIGMAEGRKMFEQALAQGIRAVADPPQELTALFEQLDNPPDWHDSTTVERGRLLWNNAGKLGMAVGDFFGTFVGDEVAHATGETHRFVNDFALRGLETNTWFWHVTMRNGLDRFATPFKNTARLRLMHAQARAGLRRVWGDEPGTPGGFAQHGNPISACMVMTAAITFGLNPLLIDHQHGRKSSWQDLEAVMMYWSYLAHLLGVPDELIPRGAADAIEIMDYVVAHAGGPSQWTDAQMGAAFNGPGLRARITRALTTPMLGVMAYYAGAPLVRALIGGTDMRGARFERWIPLGWASVNANIIFRRVFDKFPGAAWRMGRRDSDTFFRSGVWVAKLFASPRGLRGSSYTHHDSASDASIPSPHRSAALWGIERVAGARTVRRMSDDPLSASAARGARDIGVLVGRLRRRFREFYPTDLTPSQVSVLARIGKQGPLSASELAVAERVRPQSVAATLLVLDGLGLLERHPDPDDGRKQLLSLSELGREAFESSRQAGHEWLARTLDERYTAEERSTILEALALLERLTDE